MSTPQVGTGAVHSRPALVDGPSCSASGPLLSCFPHNAPWALGDLTFVSAWMVSMGEPPDVLKAMAISTIVCVTILLLAYGLLHLFTPAA